MTTKSFVALLLGLASGGAMAEAPVARAFRQEGTAEVVEKGSSARSMRAVERLSTGAILRVAAKSTVVVWFPATGRRYSLVGGASVEVGKDSVKSLAGPAPQALKALSPRAGGMVTGPTTSRTTGDLLRGPTILGAGAHRSAEDVLSWKFEGSTAYRITVVPILEPSKTTRREVPGSQVSGSLSGLGILPGGWYRLTIFATLEDGSDANDSTLVRVLTAEELSNLRGAEKEIGALEDGNDRQLMLAELFEKFDLIDEATSIYRRLAAKQKADPALAEAIRRLENWPEG